MQIALRGHGIKITAALRDYAQKKMGKIEHYFDRIITVEIQLEFKNVSDVAKRQVVEVTVFASGKKFRAVAESADMYSSIDLVFAKLEHQVVKHKEKIIKERRRFGAKSKVMPIIKRQTPSRDVVKLKRFSLKPMSPSDASNQMEQLGHAFFMFLNSETDEISVIYKRKSGDYGLIEPEI